MKKQLKDLLWLALGMLAWGAALVTLGVIARVNWELFLIGWSAL